ncbi:restriction endonuclease subunit S [Jannaschia sp. 2305UL9-9]|uniref:restriction endonuclease subunit S n=1 Tax=Jannaschia sp. 2305UL9-9 TaxID=3121638 RepID=UPI0035283A3B
MSALTKMRIDDFATMKYGKMPPKNMVSDEGYPIYSGYRVTGFAKEYLYKEPELIVVARGVGGTGDVKISPPEAWITNLSIVLSLSPELVDKKFLYYRLGREPLKERLNTGAAQAQITIENLRSYEIDLPDLISQRRIASILTAYDELIANNRRRIALLEESTRLLYREWFVHFRFPGHEHVKIIDSVPEGWEQKNLFDCVDVLSGGTPKTTVPAFWGDEIPFFTPKDTGDGPYTHDTEKMITEEGLKRCNSKLYEKDTLFVTARGTVGKIRLAQRPMAMNQSCYALRSKTYLDQAYLYFGVTEQVAHMKSRAVGAVFDAIIVDTFKNIPFLLPAKETAEDYSEIARDTLRQIDLLSSQNRQLINARDLLLPRLMDGRLEI